MGYADTERKREGEAKTSVSDFIFSEILISITVFFNA